LDVLHERGFSAETLVISIFLNHYD